MCENPRAMTRNTARATMPSTENGTVPPRPVSLKLDVTAGIVRLALNSNGDTDRFFDGREIGHTDTTRGAMVMAALVQLTAD